MKIVVVLLGGKILVDFSFCIFVFSKRFVLSMYYFYAGKKKFTVLKN